MWVSSPLTVTCLIVRIKYRPPSCKCRRFVPRTPRKMPLLQASIQSYTDFAALG